MARPTSAGSKKTPNQLAAATKALNKFKKEDAKPEPVVDVHGNTLVLKMASDHMKIIISRSIGEQLKAHIYDNEEYFDELLSWNDIFEKLLEEIQELKKQIIERSKEESESEPENNNSSSNSDYNDLSYSLFGISLEQLQRKPLQQNTIDRLKKLYKAVCQKENEYLITPDAFLQELVEIGAKEKGLEKVLDPDLNNRPKSNPGITIGTKHRNPKVGSIFRELADSQSR